MATEDRFYKKLLKASSPTRFMRGTQDIWEKADPVLEEGEPGFVTDTNQLVIGDGVKPFSLLDAISGGSGGSGSSATLPTPLPSQGGDVPLVLNETYSKPENSPGRLDMISFGGDQTSAFLLDDLSSHNLVLDWIESSSMNLSSIGGQDLEIFTYKTKKAGLYSIDIIFRVDHHSTGQISNIEDYHCTVGVSSSPDDGGPYGFILPANTRTMQQDRFVTFEPLNTSSPYAYGIQRRFVLSADVGDYLVPSVTVMGGVMDFENEFGNVDLWHEITPLVYY